MLLPQLAPPQPHALVHHSEGSPLLGQDLLQMGVNFGSKDTPRLNLTWHWNRFPLVTTSPVTSPATQTSEFYDFLNSVEI